MKTASTEVNTIDLAASRDKLARDVATLASEAGELLKDAGARNVRAAQDALAQASRAIRSGSDGMVDAAGSYVRTHPLASLAGAAAAGLVLGLLLARR